MDACEYEDGSRFQWQWIDSVPPSQARVPFAVCRRLLSGRVDGCPYPARSCRAKAEVETLTVIKTETCMMCGGSGTGRRDGEKCTMCEGEGVTYWKRVARPTRGSQ